MRKTTLISALLSLSALLSSCVKTTSRGDNFVAEFQLNTPVFYDGDEVSFTIRTNRSSVKVMAFSFRESPRFIHENETYTVKDGIWTESHAVSVADSHRGKMTVTVADPITGATKDFSAIYTAYSSTGLRIAIANKNIQSTYLKSSLPTIVSGDDFSFSITSKKGKLILKDFDCEFNDGQLMKGKEYDFGNDHELDFTMKDASFDKDGYEKPSRLSLTFSDPETERDTTVYAEYVKVVDFHPEISISPSDIHSQDVVTVSFGGNREKYRFSSLVAPEWFNYGDKLFSGQSITLKEGVDSYNVETEDITTDEDGTMIFTLYDDDYTKRTALVRVPYRARSNSDPMSVKLDRYSGTYNTEDVFLIKMSTDEEATTNTFYVEGANPESVDNLSFCAPKDEYEDGVYPSYGFVARKVKIENGGRVYVKVGRKSGDYRIKVFPAGAPENAQYFDLRVRIDIALRIKGYFTMKGETKTSYGAHSFCGWLGFPSSITADLVTYTDLDDMLPTYVNQNALAVNWASNIVMYEMGDSYQKPFSFSWIVSVGDFSTSDKLYAGYCNQNGELTIDPRSYLKTDGGNWKSTTMPGALNVKDGELQVNGPKINCKNLTLLLRKMDGNCSWWCNDYHENHEVRSNEASLKYKSLSFDFYNVVYDRENYRLKYIINLTEVSSQYGEEAPWWSVLPNGKRSLVTEYKD